MYLEETISTFSYKQIETVWAQPESVLTLVKKRLIALPFAQTNDLALTLGCWNMEYMWQAKAKHFLEPYKEIVSRHHVLAVQEVTNRGLETIAQACSYNYFVSRPNVRGQAVGFLVHPRFIVQAICEYPELMEVWHGHDLRPALQIDLFDQQSGVTFSFVTVHLKSMRGGVEFTSLIRQKQFAQLLAVLKTNNNAVIIAGDFNCYLDGEETLPLLADGYKLANPNNHFSTQSCGGRLDGLFYKNLLWQLGSYNVRNFWRSSLAGRSLSDHGLLSWKLAPR